MKIETLRWAHDRLEMIDQRILPAAFEYVSYHSAAEVAEGIRGMVVRGAPAIGVAAAYGVALEALKLSQTVEGRHSGLDLKSSGSNKLDSRLRGNDGTEDFNAGLEEGFKVLAASRPTAVNLFWALQRRFGNALPRKRSSRSRSVCWPRRMRFWPKTSASTRRWARTARPCSKTGRGC